MPPPVDLFELTRPKLWIIEPDHSLREVSEQSEEWVHSFARNQRIAYNVIGDRVAVSTVFLGCGRFPFETLVMGPQGQELAGRRYRDYAAAEAGHKRLFDEWREIVLGKR